MRLGKSLIRLLVAAPFIYQGIDAVVHSEKHADLAKRHLASFERLGIPPLQHSDLKSLAKISGVACTWAAWRLLRGKTPRLSILFLTFINASSAAVQGWQTKVDGPDQLDGSRISTALGVEAGLLALLPKPTA